MNGERSLGSKIEISFYENRKGFYSISRINLIIAQIIVIFSNLQYTIYNIAQIIVIFPNLQYTIYLCLSLDIWNEFFKYFINKRKKRGLDYFFYFITYLFFISLNYVKFFKFPFLLF